MALSVTSDLADVTTANSTTDGGTFYKLNGTASGNPALDADAHIQGTGCVASKMGATTGTTDVGSHFNHASTFDLTGKHLFHWRQIVTAGNMLTKANRGITLGLTNTSTTSTTAWSTTNFKQWFLDGSDTIPAAIGWMNYVVDPAGAADNSAGTLTLSTVKNAGFICRQSTGVTTTVSNQFVDAVRMGTGITATTTAGGDTLTMADLYATDKTNSWGIVTKYSDIYYGAGKITIGSASQGQACNFTDTGQVLVWRNFPVAATFYELFLQGASGFKTTVTLTGWIIRGQAGKTWNVNCSDAFSDFKAYSCALENLSGPVLSAGSVLSGCTISSSGLFEVNGATISSTSFSNTLTGSTAQIKLDAASETSGLTGLTFTKGANTAHAAQITAAGDYNMTGHTFSGYAASDGSTGNETFYISAASGIVNLSVDSAVSIRTAGATVNVTVGQKTLTLTDLVTGSDIVILTSGTTTVLVSVDQHGSTSYAYNYTYSAGTYIDVCVYQPGYIPWQKRSYLLPNSNGSLPVSQEADPSYVV